MKTASLTKMKSHLNSYLKTCGQEPVLVTKNGRAIAAVVAVVDPDEIERLRLANSPKLDAIFDKALKRIHRGEGLSHEQVWSQVESWADSRPRKVAPNRNSRKAKKRVTAR